MSVEGKDLLEFGAALLDRKREEWQVDELRELCLHFAEAVSMEVEGHSRQACTCVYCVLLRRAAELGVID